LIAAIRQAGLNRTHIRDAVRELSPYSGVTGQITWDPTGHNVLGG
jgi:ABC-type branched-subunit amino acid transport system substrate-binding protein